MHHSDVKWPTGFLPFYKQVRDHRERILNGTVVAVDPSSGGSSLPGFSIYRAGELITSGEIKLSEKKLPIYERLQILHDRVTKLTSEVPDVFGLEMIRGQGFSSQQLIWSVGVTIAAARTPNCIEVPMHAWKAVAKVTPGYFKGDAQDAEMIGLALVLIARKFEDEIQDAQAV